MGNTNEGFDVWLRTHFDGNALAAARESFDKTKGKAKETDSAMKDLGLSAESLKGQLIGLVGVAAVWQQFKEGFEQVAALEQAMNQLERATKRNGESFDVVRGKIVGMAESLKKAAGVDDDAAIKGMVELYNATGDVTNAMDLARLAADVAVGSNKSYEESLKLVTGAAQGKTRALVALGLAQDDDTEATLNAEEALRRIQASFGGAAQDAKGLTVELNRLKEGWEDVRNETVERVTPSLEVVLKLVLSFFAALDGAWRLVSDAVVGALGVIGKAGSFIKSVLTGDMAGAKAAIVGMGHEIKGTTDSMVQGAKDAAKKIEDIWKGTREKIELGTKTPSAIGGGGGAETEAQKKAREKAAKEEEELAKRVFEFEQGLIKERAAAWAKYEAAKLALSKGSAKEMERIEKELDKERERMMDAQTARIRDQVRLQKQAEQSKREQAWATADAAIGAGYAVFGESKGIAIAEAIINTAKGATAAYPNFVLMALIIASGLAQVAKIRSTEPSGGGDATQGKGFDVPSYDAAAVAGGRRWAMDMVGKWGAGASAGWAEGMAGAGRGSTTYDNRSTVNLHMSVAGFLDPSDQHQMAKFARNLAVVNKTVEGQRRTARTSR
jgi:hypothetical protein